MMKSSFGKSFFIALGLFVLLEIILRITGADRVGSEKFYRNIFDPMPAFIPGQVNPYADLAEFLNKDGFRGPDFEPRKKPWKTRILCLGDSRTFGMVQYRDAYPSLLEKALNQGRSRHFFEVINAGIPGTNIFQHRLLFQKIFKDVDMDLVLLVAEPNFRPEIRAFRENMHDSGGNVVQHMKRLLSHLAVYRVMRRWTHKQDHRATVDDFQIEPPPIGGYENREFMADYKEDLMVIRELVTKKGATLVLLGAFDKKTVRTLRDAGFTDDQTNGHEPIKAYIFDKQAAAFAREFEVPYIDLAQAFLKVDENESDLWKDPNHPGALGNRIIAETIAKQLIALGLINENPN